MANEVVKKKIDIMASVQKKLDTMVQNGNIIIPKNYNVSNALVSAKLKLKKPIAFGKDAGKCLLETCSAGSIQNALFDMAIQGLSPSKNQCYFVGFKGSCEMMRSYLGTVAVAKRFTEVKDVKAYAIFEGDKFETKFNTKNGNLEIAEYEPKFDNIDVSKVVGAFCMLFDEKGNLLRTEIMKKAQLEQAWKQGFSYKAVGGVHQKFAEEMSKKTVAVRALKWFVNTSDDVNDTIADAWNSENKSEDDFQEAEVIEEKEEIFFSPETEEVQQEATEEKSTEVVEEIQEAEIIEPEQQTFSPGF